MQKIGIGSAEKLIRVRAGPNEFLFAQRHESQLAITRRFIAAQLSRNFLRFRFHQSRVSKNFGRYSVAEHRVTNSGADQFLLASGGSEGKELVGFQAFRERLLQVLHKIAPRSEERR